MRKRSVTPVEELLAPLLETPFVPTVFTVCGKKIPYMRLEIPIIIDDLFEWLSAQNLFPKVYFEDPRDGVVAGIGKAVRINEVPYFDEGTGPRFFGGSDFMERKRKTWDGIPPCAYFLPLIEVEKREQGTFLCINRVQEKLDFSLEKEVPLQEMFEVQGRLDSPSYPVWEREVSEILKGIHREDYLKVVLARCTKWEWEGECSPYALLRKLQGGNRFSFQFSEDQAFIGNSPETLYRRTGDRVESAAIAGTRPRGRTPEEEVNFRDELLNCPKERHEFQVVQEMIVHALSPLCNELEVGGCTILQTAKVQHLHSPITGKLRGKTSDRQLIETLHPTPAVGGFPREKGFEEIGKRESFDRGWYAAPVGYVSPEKAHHLVAIRSALVEKEGIRLFAGTGLVNGSIPSKEWEELEHKTTQYREML